MNNACLKYFHTPVYDRSCYHGHVGQLQYSGLLNFGSFDNLSYQVRLRVTKRSMLSRCVRRRVDPHSVYLSFPQYWEIPLIFIPMGIIGGLLGALFVTVNVKVCCLQLCYTSIVSPKFILVRHSPLLLNRSLDSYFQLSKFRMAHVTRPLTRVVEALLVAAVSAAVFFLFIYLQVDCQSFDIQRTEIPVQAFCNDGEVRSLTRDDE